MLAESYTAIIARGEDWTNGSSTEPYEASWAREATIVLRTLEADKLRSPAKVRVQISIDGLNWMDEGTVIDIPASENKQSFARLERFCHYLRLSVDMAPGESAFMLASLSLKG